MTRSTRVWSVGTMRVTSISFTLLTTILTLTSCCFISDCPERGKKRMMYSFNPRIRRQIVPAGRVGQPVESQQLTAIPNKKDMRAMLDSPHTNSDLKVSKRDLRFLYSMLYNPLNMMASPRQGEDLTGNQKVELFYNQGQI